MKKRIALYGSTGSIGTSTLNVIRNHPDLFAVSSLIAGRRVRDLIAQIEEFHPQHVYITAPEHAQMLKEKFPDLDIYWGQEGMQAISQLTDFEIGVSALVGVAGLRPTYNMICQGKTVALANKEVLVTGGGIVMDAARAHQAQLLTVDSEHSAIMQCLNGEKHAAIDKILLTASGGPFFDKPITEAITPEQALAHPTWSMGPKITIDSATMMNKGFEIIEARWLFDVAPKNIQVVIHRQSLVHSMVQFVDGTIMASIAPASMELPIAYALTYPDRIPCPNIKKLDLFAIKQLQFFAPDYKKFRCLQLALDAASCSHSAQVVLNAANEVMVDAFLHHRTTFPSIPRVLDRVLQAHSVVELNSVDDVLALDEETRIKVNEILEGEC